MPSSPRSFYYRNVTFARDGQLAYDSAILTAAVIFLLAVASVFQYLMGVIGRAEAAGRGAGAAQATHWLFLLGTALITMMFGMVLEGLPAAVVLIPVVFPIAEKMGIDPIHFNIVQTAAVGIGLFLPPMGVGLLMALKFANLTVGQHWRAYLPYIAALLVGLMLIILFPQLSLFLPNASASGPSSSDLGHRQPMVLAVARGPARSTGPRPGRSARRRPESSPRCDAGRGSRRPG